MEAAMSDIGPEGRAVLDGGRDGDDPGPADRARIRAAVMRSIAVGTALGAASATTEAAAGVARAGLLASGWKVVAGLVVMGAVGAGLVVSRERPPAPSAARAAGPALPAGLAPTAGPALPVGAVASPPVNESPAASAVPPPAAAAPRASVEPVRSAAAPRPTSVAPPPVAVEPPPVGEPPPTLPAPPAAPPAPPDTLAAEATRLREAHGALQGGDAARALALLDEQGAAGAQLREERAAARVLALCQLGKVDEARAAAARFLQESPRSPLADRVRASCAGH
jgi:hypothetical protein